MTGLLRAVDAFDPDRGNRLCTYATRLIRRAMLRATEHAPTIRLPAACRRELAAILRAEDELAPARPSAVAPAARCGVPLRHVERLRTAAHVVSSLDAPMPGTDDMTLAELIGDPSAPSVATAVAGADSRRDLIEAVSSLPPRARRVLRLRYALDGGARTPDRGHGPAPPACVTGREARDLARAPQRLAGRAAAEEI